jgi:hypothetical protein
MKIPKRPWLVAMLASLVALAAAAIEPPQPANAPPAQQAPGKPDPAQSPPPDAPADGAAKGENAPEADDEEKLPPLPAGTEPSGPPPQRFNPTEKVRADFPVSFPIDI